MTDIKISALPTIAQGSVGVATDSIPITQGAVTYKVTPTALVFSSINANSTGSGSVVLSTSPVINAPDINGGTVDGAVIGGAVPAAGSFTTLSASGGLSVTGGISATESALLNGAGLKQLAVVSSDNNAQIKLTTLGQQDWSFGVDRGASGAFKIAASLILTDLTRLTLDASGNLGLGVVPSAWGAYRAMQVGQSGSVSCTVPNGVVVSSNAFNQGGAGWKYINTNTAAQYEQYNGAHYWSTAPSGTAGQPISFTQAMTLDASGNLLVGTTSGACHTFVKIFTVANAIVAVSNGTIDSVRLNASDAQGWNGNGTVLNVGYLTGNGRSINAGGTINASGADYAEYERNNCLTFAKGDLVGFKADGTLTATFSEAIRFAVKSTAPSYVGGDTWGNEEAIGFKKTDSNTAEFEAALEVARQQVDRIAYSGKVPCNVTGAAPGDYIIAAANLEGQIHGWSVTDPDFSQYKKAVGRVNRILPDGRCEVAVIIH